MKLFFRLILIGVFTYFLSMFLPWWILVLVAFIVGWLIPGASFSSFTSGFLGVGFVWMGYAWHLDANNDSQFSTLMTSILPVGDNIILLVIVGLVGGLCGGFATMTGALLRSSKPKKNSGSLYQ